MLARLARGAEPGPVLDLLASASDDAVLRLRLDSLVAHLANRDFPAARLAYHETIMASWRYRAAHDIARLGMRCTLFDTPDLIAPAMSRAMDEEPALLTIITGPGAAPRLSREPGSEALAPEIAGRRALYAWHGGPLPITAALCLNIWASQDWRTEPQALVLVSPPSYSPLLPLMNPDLVRDRLSRLRARGGVAVYHLGATSIDHLLGSYHLAGGVESESATHHYFLTRDDRMLDDSDRRHLDASSDSHGRGRIALSAAEALFTRATMRGWGARCVVAPEELAWQAAAVADIARGEYLAASDALRCAGTTSDVLVSLPLCLAMAGRGAEAEKSLRDVRLRDAAGGELASRVVRTCFER